MLCLLAVCLWSTVDCHSIAVDAKGGLALSPDGDRGEPLLRRSANATGAGDPQVLLESLSHIWIRLEGLETPEALATAEKERHAMSTLAYVWFPSALVMALLFEALHLPWAEVDWSLPLDRSDGQEGSEKVDASFAGLTLRLARRGGYLAWIYFAGAGRVKGRFYLILLVWIHFVGMYLELVTFDFRKRYWNLYQQPSLPLFFELIRNWFILHFTRMITFVYEFYMEDIFLLHWRDHLTRYFQAIWVPNTYAFRITEGQRFDNPDQRIQVDVAEYVSQTYSLTFGVMKMILNFMMYCYMLMSITPSSMHPGSLVCIALAYSALGTAVMHVLGSKLAHYSWSGERCSGDFRSELRRVYDQSESVAGLRSDDAELARLQHRFERIKLNTWQTMLLEKRLAVVQKWYGPLREVLFMCILAPFFIKGEVSLGRLKQCEMALDQISDSLSFLVENYSSLSSYRAVVDRLYNFRRALVHFRGEDEPGAEMCIIEELAPLGIPAKWPPFLGGCSKAPEIRQQAELSELSLDARVYLPSGDPLLDVQLKVPRGSSVLLCGEEGAGKSTVLRALAGIWPFLQRFDAEPPASQIILIPQKPSLPMPMSLREAACFPEAEKFSEEEIREALEKVGLDASSLDVPLDVNSMLSGGEFQKLMVAHCLLAKPRFILLDESMAHMSRPNQLRMYQLLGELVKNGTGLCTTSHCWQELMPFSLCYTIQTTTSQDGKIERRVVPFTPGEQTESLSNMINQKDREIERLREEIRHLQNQKKSHDA